MGPRDLAERQRAFLTELLAQCEQALFGPSSEQRPRRPDAEPASAPASRRGHGPKAQPGTTSGGPYATIASGGDGHELPHTGVVNGVCVGDGHPADIVYDDTADRSRAGRVIEVGCMAHARRYFRDAKTSDPPRALLALGFIQQIYAVEREVTEAAGF